MASAVLFSSIPTFPAGAQNIECLTLTAAQCQPLSADNADLCCIALNWQQLLTDAEIEQCPPMTTARICAVVEEHDGGNNSGPTAERSQPMGQVALLLRPTRRAVVAIRGPAVRLVDTWWYPWWTPGFSMIGTPGSTDNGGGGQNPGGGGSQDPGGGGGQDPGGSGGQNPPSTLAAVAVRTLAVVAVKTLAVVAVRTLAVVAIKTEY